MSNEEIRDLVNETIADVLNLDDEGVLGADTTAKDVPGWDSLAHVRIVLSVERRFKIRFAENDIAGLKQISDIYSLVEQKLSA